MPRSFGRSDGAILCIQKETRGGTGRRNPGEVEEGVIYCFVRVTLCEVYLALLLFLFFLLSFYFVFLLFYFTTQNHLLVELQRKERNENAVISSKVSPATSHGIRS